MKSRAHKSAGQGTFTFADYMYSVSELTREIKVLLETALPTIWVEGEVSNFLHHSSGHMYFVLKDENAQLSCVMWRSRNATLRFRPEDGMRVQARGRISLYEKRGSYQLDVDRMLPGGVGELQLAFEALKARLQEEGLFDSERKKPIPRLPRSVGIVTSPTGAAIRDLVSVMQRRSPGIELVLRPVRVQGDGAAAEIAQAIRDFNSYGQVDVLIVGRGGGSLEDLWAFNEEIVARAISESELPVISAVGHEIDFSISDFVADVRAATPSAAAELAVPERQEELGRLSHLEVRLHRVLRSRVALERERISSIQSSYAFRKPIDAVLQSRRWVDDLAREAQRSIQRHFESRRQSIATLREQMTALNPRKVLERGYAICYRAEDDRVVNRAEMLRPEGAVRVQFHAGQIEGQVTRVLLDDGP